jgi:biopolymer transport protein ExbB
MRRVAFLAGILALPAAAHAWWSSDWTARKEILIDTTTAGADTQATLSDVPVLIRLHAGNFPQFLTVRDNGADFRFTAGDDTTPLKYHVERFDPISQIAFVWVKVPSLVAQSNTNRLYFYFGNQAAPAGDDPGASYDVNTVGVFHFNQPTGQPQDSTSYGTQATAQVVANPASLVGSGALLTGTGSLSLVDAPHLHSSPDRGWTFSTWLKLDEFPAATAGQVAYLLDRRGAENRLSVTLNGNQLSVAYNDNQVTASTPLTQTQWHHIAVVTQTDQIRLYLDGVEVASLQAPLGPLEGNVVVGGSADGNAFLTGAIDELQVSNVARSPDWIAFASGVQGTKHDRILAYGMDEAEEGGTATAKQTGHFGIIFQNVFGKKDAWVEQLVIASCGVMMAIAIMIMFLKAVDVNRAAKASRKFLKAYATLGTDAELASGSATALDALFDARRALGDSPLWRVYHTGLDEIRKRLSPAVGAQAAGIDSKALATVRAAMDAAMVRETQRLNSKLVLLTIAISGGPFIGLLGTVVGVMVTFAAIAATGDVNIAAIAPGMAAALLATVAGLGVAIPSLFGYNYLSSRVKELSADMHVFADELEARFNETYGV